MGDRLRGGKKGARNESHGLRLVLNRPCMNCVAWEARGGALVAHLSIPLILAPSSG